MALPTTITSARTASEHRADHQTLHAQHNQTLNVKTFGATGDGTTDDTTAVQSAWTAAVAIGAAMYFPAGTYVIANLSFSSNNKPVTLFGDGWGSVIKQKTGAMYAVSINGSSSNATLNPTGITIKGLRFVGTVATDLFSEHFHLLNINAVSDVLVSGCWFEGWRGDGIYLGSSNDGATERHNRRVRIVDSFFDGINNDNRQAISIIDCWNLNISRCTFRRCTRTDMPGAIDVEPNPLDLFPVTWDINISDNQFEACGGGVGVVTIYLPETQASLTSDNSSLIIRGNQFRNDVVVDGGASIRLIQQQSPPGAATPPNTIIIADNVCTNGKRPFHIDGLRGVIIHDNIFDKMAGSSFVGETRGCRDVSVHHNMFMDCGSVQTAALILYNATGVSVDHNKFINCGTATTGIMILVKDNSTFTDLSVQGNEYTGPRCTDVVAKGTGVVTTASSNTYYNNKASSTVTSAIVATGLFGHTPVAVIV